MDMEINFLHECFSKKDPKQLMDHIQRMGSGEAPLFAKTLGLVYDRLIEKTFTRPVPFGSGLGKSVEVQSVADPAPPPEASSSISSVPPTPIGTSGTLPFSPQPPAPSPIPIPVSLNASSRLAQLVCVQCRESAFLAVLYDGLRCPQCPPRSGGRGRPWMRCQLCSTVRAEPRTNCIKNSCQARFW